MENILIHGSRRIPTVILDPESGLFELRGNSIPEDAGEFYKPIFNKIEEYFMSPYPLTIVSIHLDYYNTSTAKWLLMMFQLFKRFSDMGHQIFYKWYYDEGDDEVYDSVQDYSKILNMNINLCKAS